MKVIFIGTDRNIFKSSSAVQRRFLDYGKLFEEVHLIVLSAKKDENKEFNLASNIFVYPTNHLFKITYLWSIYKITKRIIKKIGREAIVSSQDPFETGLAAWLVKKIFKLSLQIQIHTDILSPYFIKEFWINHLRVYWAKFLIFQADRVRVVSFRILKSLSIPFTAISKFIVLPIYVENNCLKESTPSVNLHYKYPQFDKIILMASRLTKEKNIILALEAFNELIKKYPKLGLVVVGSGPEENKIKEKIKKDKLVDSVIVEKWSDNLTDYYKTADIFVLTSNYEGYCRTVIEAMICGLPIVMTDVGLANEIIIDNKNGLIVPVGDSKTLSSAISRLLYDTSLRESFIKKSEETLRQLMTKEKYLELFKQSFII
ncbi:MAG TPA: glycosyltransferase family 4 protein [Candidatus Magasanikbacteria bacterium]|nr:glycosyltransferase family 4 protein [Candidatus Magasanikbacteria bacterium]